MKCSFWYFCATQVKHQKSHAEECCLNIIIDQLKSSDFPPLIDVLSMSNLSEIDAVDVCQNSSYILLDGEYVLSLLRAVNQKLRMIDLVYSSSWKDVLQYVSLQISKSSLVLIFLLNSQTIFNYANALTPSLPGLVIHLLKRTKLLVFFYPSPTNKILDMNLDLLYLTHFLIDMMVRIKDNEVICQAKISMFYLMRCMWPSHQEAWRPRFAIMVLTLYRYHFIIVLVCSLVWYEIAYQVSVCYELAYWYETSMVQYVPYWELWSGTADHARDK